MNVEKELKDFIYNQLNTAKRLAKDHYDVEKYRAIAFGAMWFAEQTHLVDYKTFLNFWENEEEGIWYQFIALENDIKRKNISNKIKRYNM